MIWAFRLEGNFIQTLLIQHKMYAFFEATTKDMDTPFPIKDFVSIYRDLNLFDVILPLFSEGGRFE